MATNPKNTTWQAAHNYIRNEMRVEELSELQITLHIYLKRYDCAIIHSRGLVRSGPYGKNIYESYGEGLQVKKVK